MSDNTQYLEQCLHGRLQRRFVVFPNSYCSYLTDTVIHPKNKKWLIHLCKGQFTFYTWMSLPLWENYDYLHDILEKCQQEI